MQTPTSTPTPSAEGHGRLDAPELHHADHKSDHASGHGRRMLLMLLPCVAMLAAVILVVGGTGRSLGSLGWIIVILLLCPLLHLFMHRNHGTH